MISLASQPTSARSLRAEVGWLARLGNDLGRNWCLLVTGLIGL